MDAQASTAAETVLQQVTASALQVFQARACSIALLQGEELVYVHASGDGADQIVGTRLPVSRGLAGYAISGGKPVAIWDVANDPRFARDIAEATGYLPTAIVAAPVQTQRGSYGVLTVLDPAVSGPVGERLLELVVLLAHQAALTVEGATASRAGEGHTARAELISIVENLPDAQIATATAMLRRLAE